MTINIVFMHQVMVGFGHTTSIFQTKHHVLNVAVFDQVNMVHT